MRFLLSRLTNPCFHQSWEGRSSQALYFGDIGAPQRGERDGFSLCFLNASSIILDRGRVPRFPPAKPRSGIHQPAWDHGAEHAAPERQASTTKVATSGRQKLASRLRLADAFSTKKRPEPRQLPLTAREKAGRPSASEGPFGAPAA